MPAGFLKTRHLLFESIIELVTSWQEANKDKRDDLAEVEQSIAIVRLEIKISETLDDHSKEQQRKRAELEAIMLDNEAKLQQLRQQIRQDKLAIIEQVFEQFEPNLSDEQKEKIKPRLLEALDNFMTRPLQLQTPDELLVESEPQTFDIFSDIYDFLGSSPTRQEILNFRLPGHIQERIATLLQANKEGTLTPEESRELDEYERLEHRLRMQKINARTESDMA
jgi:hypothetical protein